MLWIVALWYEIENAPEFGFDILKRCSHRRTSALERSHAAVAAFGGLEVAPRTKMSDTPEMRGNEFIKKVTD